MPTSAMLNPSSLDSNGATAPRLENCTAMVARTMNRTVRMPQRLFNMAPLVQEQHARFRIKSRRSCTACGFIGMINGANIGWQLGSAKKLRAARCRYRSVLGTFETCRPVLRMSVHRGRPEVAVVAVKPTRMMGWTTPASGIECAKG